MTEFEETILERLKLLESEVKRLKSEKAAAAADVAARFEQLPENATVGKDYAAYRFGCSEEAVVRGRAGTHLLRTKRVSDKPLKFIKRDVDAAWKQYTKPAAEKAAEERFNSKPVKRRGSIITKHPQTA